MITLYDPDADLTLNIKGTLYLDFHTDAGHIFTCPIPLKEICRPISTTQFRLVVLGALSSQPHGRGSAMAKFTLQWQRNF